MATSGGVPYLGSRIVLISKKEIRYEGTLYTIDTTNSTVALQNVRSFGTEDRQPDNPIPANEEVFDYIIFRGTDIKDLHVCETSSDSATAPPPPAATSMPEAQPEPTAPSTQAPPPKAAAPPPEAAAPPPAWGANPSQARSSTAAPPQPAQTVAPPPAPVATGGRGAGTGTSRVRAQPGTGAHISARAVRGVGNGAQAPSTMEAEFDFEKMLAGFDKIAMEREAANKVNSSESYNKASSFFDSLDEEVIEEGGRKGGRAFMAEMRKVDALTFGEELIKERGRGRGKGKGRGGGRGGGRGMGGMGENGARGGGGKGGGRGPRPNSAGGKGGGRGGGSRNVDSDTFGAEFASTQSRGAGGRGREGRGRGGEGGAGRGPGRGRGGGRGGPTLATGAAPPVVTSSA